ncbi:hypothetical protein NDN08_004467 [Rhodosorus marinus]|uniref:Voltage-dependent anion-selective channel protein 2 n=1 Tax=Rhodosorus marinus TaxID=101924 RepID=A0AAV8ULR1_9RHOD|nr:hypothetical protein NDN08_004467 [Rhodosorus marinus]
MVKSYADFGKSAKNLLKDDYVVGKKAEVKTATADGVNFTATGIESDKDGALSGSLSWKYKVYGNAFTTKVTTANVISNEAVFEDIGVKGLKTTVNGSLGTASQSASAKVDYKHDAVAATILADVKDQTLTPSVAVGYKMFSLGGTATLENSSKSVSQYSLGACLAQDDSEVAISTTDKFNLFKLSFGHTISPKYEVAAEASYNREKSSVSMATGLKYVTDSATIKAKTDNLGTLSLAYIAKIDSSTKLTMSTSANVKELEKGQKFGIAVTLDQP